MKLNEFSKKSKKPVNEALSDWFGTIGADLGKKIDSFKGLPSGQSSLENRLARKQFVDDFVGKTAYQLRDLVKSGQLSTSASTTSGTGGTTAPTSTGLKQPANPTNPNAQQTTAPAGQSTQPQMGKAPSTSQSQSATQPASQNFKPQGYGPIKLNAPTGLTPQQPIKPTSAPKQSAQPQQNKPTAPGKTPSGAGGAAFSSMASNLQGINPNIQPSQTTSSTSSTGGTTTRIPAQNTPGTTQHQAGPLTNVKQQVARSIPKQQSRMNQGPNVWSSNRLKEDQYRKLNNIFEGLLSLDENSGAGISDWLMKKITTYMQGYDLAQYASTIKKYADQVQSSYGTGGSAGERQIVEPLKMLGNLLYTILETERKTEPSKEKLQPGQKQPTTPTNQPQGSGVTPYKQITNLLPKLNTTQKQRLLKILSAP